MSLSAALQSRGLNPLSEEDVAEARLLLVGAGGIGCELLKTLVQFGFRKITVVDLDTIDVSNLNRQFLFRKHHVGQSKALVACETVRSFVSQNTAKLELSAHHANIKEDAFDKAFFDQFALVLNALDNVNARQHVNRMCLASRLPLVDAGTTGYLGQTSVIKRGETQCFDCEPKREDKNKRFPICTIRSTPDKPVHCIVWAKELFKLMFGNARESDLVDLDDAADKSLVMLAVQPFNHVDQKPGYAESVFRALFFEDISLKKEMRKQDATYQPVPLVLDEIQREASSTSASARDLWTLRECWQEFERTTGELLGRRRNNGAELEFDKDDAEAMRFVCAAANLRCEVFGIARKSLFDVKGIAGNIIHAIATTNAIVAGIQVLECVRLLANSKADPASASQTRDSRLVWVNRAPSSGQAQMLLVPSQLERPIASCVACGKAEMHLFVDVQRATLEVVVVDVLEKRLGLRSPMVTVGTSSLVYETGQDLDEEDVAMYSANLRKTLAQMMTNSGAGGELIFSVSDLFQTLSFRLVVHHRAAKLDEQSGELVGDLFELKGETPKVVEEDTSSSSKRVKLDKEDDVKPEEEEEDDIEIL